MQQFFNYIYIKTFYSCSVFDLLSLYVKFYKIKVVDMFSVVLKVWEPLVIVGVSKLHFLNLG